ncbi:hypothetical protein ASPZODRAFT_60644 [Penicilliopsis zonata CBS 506.65]|uniref:COP9 signalosome complex subunit 6 n=1 Tax=Penicilliopsis zonata CBS 506.65 TaxID=1073090 RepID=A0A1L9SPB9_9EURO|nr:hypothetical protein ASPZODRAFT_60644 [Penicilliopsis zonata CBS 506.65]OJJ48904.1 hypothetical protein ASPZODRAFT_60644 [Penicilliopsis zonata CBS 506.65]
MADPSIAYVSQTTSDSGLHIQLHPLVLLSVSDHLTRHAARKQQGPVIGALLGQQNGREISLEHAFECKVVSGPNGELLLSQPWFDERLKQLKDVHKEPALDLVGWWSTAPPTGPDSSHIPIQRQVLQDYNESAVFLAFHPSQLQSASERGGKLPITIYEGGLDSERAADGDRTMQVDGEEPSLQIRFQELPYTVETGEAEMIGIEHIAQGGGNAASSSSLGKKNESSADDDRSNVGVLTEEEEEMIASLNTRLNAIRMLESRISLIKAYLSNISSTTTTTPPPGSADQKQSSPPRDPTMPPLSHPILREINSLLAHLSLLSPGEQSGFTAESLAQTNDVLLVSLLGQLGQGIKSMRELGRKSAIVQNTRQNIASRKSQMAAMQTRLQNPYSTGGSGNVGGMYVD